MGEDGSVWAWGSNWRGQLGDGTTEDSDVPVCVPGIVEAVAVAVAGGGRRSLALLSDGRVLAWGAGEYGQSGPKVAPWSPVPLNVGLAEGPLVVSPLRVSRRDADVLLTWSAIGRTGYEVLRDTAAAFDAPLLIDEPSLPSSLDTAVPALAFYRVNAHCR